VGVFIDSTSAHDTKMQLVSGSSKNYVISTADDVVVLDVPVNLEEYFVIDGDVDLVYDPV